MVQVEINSLSVSDVRRYFSVSLYKRSESRVYGALVTGAFGESTPQ